MKPSKRKALEAAGFKIGNVDDFLGLSEEEMQLIDLRVTVCRAIRRLREKRKLSQQSLAQRINSSQSRIAKMESGSSNVSLDLMFRGFFAVGGKLSDLTKNNGEGAKPKPKTKTTAR